MTRGASLLAKMFFPLAGILLAALRPWPAWVLGLTVAFVVRRWYRLHADRLRAEQARAAATGQLHLRTIEALALAIEAKDEGTLAHLRRVQVYALGVGRALGLAGPELEALAAAALLHDVGKLAVPEHILSKPGRLTPEEFEKMKIHPVMGAGIVERAGFPYPVAPMVRSHHERWDGTGYPDGLSGTRIPLGARILAAVDTLDALATDRQYRPAMPLAEAMQAVAAEAGTGFDPRVVAILQQRYLELEREAQQRAGEGGRIVAPEAVGGARVPRNGLERVPDSRGSRLDFLTAIASARHEAQLLYEFTQVLGNSLNLRETLSVLDSRLCQLVPYAAMAVYVRQNGFLLPEYARGVCGARLSVACGTAGWVTETGRMLVNGYPAAEEASGFASALSAPLEGASGRFGVLCLYHADADAFTGDHVRILKAMLAKISMAVENALRYRAAAEGEHLAARQFFVKMEHELQRARADGDPVTLLVGDLDGLAEIRRRRGPLYASKTVRAAAEAVRRCCSESDLLGRMGADEFVVLLPGMRAQEAGERIAILRRAVDRASNGALAFEAAAATFPDDGAQTEELLAAADRRLYAAAGA
ncbi:MAG: HD domain-containing phosphohydrolase [Bryobacteraceae bacterium]